MRCMVVFPTAVLFSTVLSIAGHSAPPAPEPGIARRAPVTLVQGWWEEEHREHAREQYWRLPPPALDRYNRLQYEINQLIGQRREIDERLRRAQEEQRRMLGFTR